MSIFQGKTCNLELLRSVADKLLLMRCYDASDEVMAAADEVEWQRARILELEEAVAKLQEARIHIVRRTPIRQGVF